MDLIRIFRRWVLTLCVSLSTVGNVALITAMVLVTVDVAGRDFFNQGVLGTYEMVEYLMVPLAFFSFGLAQLRGAHIKVDVVARHMPTRLRAAMRSVTLTLMLGLLVMIAWSGYEEAVRVFYSQAVSSARLIPRWPFVALMVLGTIVFCLAVFSDLLTAIARAVGKEVELETDSDVELIAD